MMMGHQLTVTIVFYCNSSITFYLLYVVINEGKEQYPM
jgi:hypothetical protein